MMNLAEYRSTATRPADYLAMGGTGRLRRRLEQDELSEDREVSRPRSGFRRRGRAGRQSPAASTTPCAVSGSGWSIFAEAQRSEAATYPDSRFPDAASALVDAELGG